MESKLAHKSLRLQIQDSVALQKKNILRLLHGNAQSIHQPPRGNFHSKRREFNVVLIRLTVLSLKTSTVRAFVVLFRVKKVMTGDILIIISTDLQMFSRTDTS